MVPNSTVMAVAVIFTFKNDRCKKNSHIFVIKWKLQVRLSMQKIKKVEIFIPLEMYTYVVT